MALSLTNPPKKQLDPEIEKIEIELVLEGILRYYGFDFREYATGTIRNHLGKSIRNEKLKTLSEFQERILHDPGCLERFMATFGPVCVGFFGEPGFYSAFRRKVVPILRTYPFLRIWQVGCSTGEELYSLATLLQEENLCNKTNIYTTDISASALEEAKKGAFPLATIRRSKSNYLKSGGIGSFADHYTVHGNQALFDPSLRKNMIFAVHNLVTDASFNEFNVIFCRNVLSIFSQPLAGRVLKLLKESLVMLGFLALGGKERIRSASFKTCFKPIDLPHKLYRRIPSCP